MTRARDLATTPLTPHLAIGEFTGTATGVNNGHIFAMTAHHDPSGILNVAQKRLIIPRMGRYLITAQQLISMSSAGAMYWHLCVNGNTQHYAYIEANNFRDAHTSTGLVLAAGDYIDWRVVSTASFTSWGGTHSRWTISELIL